MNYLISREQYLQNQAAKKINYVILILEKSQLP